MTFLLWLVSLVAVAGYGVALGSGDDEHQVLVIVLPTVAGSILLIAVAIGVVLCVAVYCYKKRTSLDYLLSRDTVRSEYVTGEKRSLVSNDYDSVYTGDLTHTDSQNLSSRHSPPAQEAISDYSFIRASHFISSKNGSRSRSLTPEPSLSMGIKSSQASYGAVDHDSPTSDNPYSYVRVDRQRFSGSHQREHSESYSHQRESSESDRYARVRRPTTSIHQSIKHYRSGTYVPSKEQRTGPTEPHYETEKALYDRLQFFETSKAYWIPAKSSSALYDQLSSNRYREIPRKLILILEQIGAGQFGTVYKGLWMCDGESLHVAVKALQESSSEEERVKFLQEAALMGQFSHPNIISIYGVVTITAPTLIVLELATTDLHMYLRSIRLSEQYTDHLPGQLLQFSWEIAAGMEYLSKKSFVHRDLAARNILLDPALVCKIGDFGMARDLMDEEFYTSTDSRPLPVKWMAPEALLFRTYSTASDVWSYGMVLYEIWSVGQKPYQDLTNKDVIEQLEDRRCQPPPPGCPRAIYKLMVDCWHPEAKHRPTFHQLHQGLHQPEEFLLTWLEEDMRVSSSANQLGANPSHSQYLYTDLQRKYLADS